MIFLNFYLQYFNVTNEIMYSLSESNLKLLLNIIVQITEYKIEHNLSGMKKESRFYKIFFYFLYLTDLLSSIFCR